MGARSQADITRELSTILLDIMDALNRGVTLMEISQAIAKLEQTPRREEKRA